MLAANARQFVRDASDQHPLIAAALVCAATSAILLPLHASVDLLNVAMAMLLLVALVAARWGRAPAVLASVWNVIVFDIGFVPPRGSLHVHDAKYLMVFAVMLAVALVVSHISGHLRDRERAAHASERQQHQLYQLAAELNRALRHADVVAVVERFLAGSYGAKAYFHPAIDAVTGEDGAAAQPQLGVDDDPARPLIQMQPLQGATRLRGTLELRLPPAAATDSVARAQAIAIVAGLMAAALERLHYFEVAARTQVEVESERLRNALLASLSHDLRTPLTVLYGHADALREAAAGLPALEREAASVCDEAMRASRLCESLLELARLRSSPRLLQRQWVALEELIGAAIASLQGMSGVEHIEVDLPEDLPWLQLDPLMFERVIANLIDNALKQGGLAQRIQLGAGIDASSVTLSVRNTGSRFPDAPMDLLDAFVRGGRGDDVAGYGVGLAICQAVVEAHGGRIELHNLADAAEVLVHLPRPSEPMPELPEPTSVDRS